MLLGSRPSTGIVSGRGGSDSGAWEPGVGGRSDDVDECGSPELGVGGNSGDVDAAVSDTRLPTPDSPEFGVLPAAIHANPQRHSAPAVKASFFIAPAPPAFRA